MLVLARQDQKRTLVGYWFGHFVCLLVKAVTNTHKPTQDHMIQKRLSTLVTRLLLAWFYIVVSSALEVVGLHQNHVLCTKNRSEKTNALMESILVAR